MKSAHHSCNIGKGECKKKKIENVMARGTSSSDMCPLNQLTEGDSGARKGSLTFKLWSEEKRESVDEFQYER